MRKSERNTRPLPNSLSISNEIRRKLFSRKNTFNSNNKLNERLYFMSVLQYWCYKICIFSQCILCMGIFPRFVHNRFTMISYVIIFGAPNPTKGSQTSLKNPRIHELYVVVTSTSHRYSFRNKISRRILLFMVRMFLISVPRDYLLKYEARRNPWYRRHLRCNFG